jgi:hypothetical protein
MVDTAEYRLYVCLSSIQADGLQICVLRMPSSIRSSSKFLCTKAEGETQ